MSAATSGRSACCCTRWPAGERPFRGATGFELAAPFSMSPPAPLPERVPDELSRVIHQVSRKKSAGSGIRPAPMSAPRSNRPERREPAPPRAAYASPSSGSTGFRLAYREHSPGRLTAFSLSPTARCCARCRRRIRPASDRRYALPECQARQLPIQPGCRAACPT